MCILYEKIILKIPPPLSVEHSTFFLIHSTYKVIAVLIELLSAADQKKDVWF